MKLVCNKMTPVSEVRNIGECKLPKTVLQNSMFSVLLGIKICLIHGSVRGNIQMCLIYLTCRELLQMVKGEKSWLPEGRIQIIWYVMLTECNQKFSKSRASALLGNTEFVEDFGQKVWGIKYWRRKSCSWSLQHEKNISNNRLDRRKLVRYLYYVYISVNGVPGLSSRMIAVLYTWFFDLLMD